jgi:hypothetical protein
MPLKKSELLYIKKHNISDVELSKKIGRSVEAIQIARWKIKVGIYVLSGNQLYRQAVT